MAKIWKSYLTTRAGFPASILLDAALDPATSGSENPALLEISIRIKSPDANGFPTDSESSVLFDFEDVLTAQAILAFYAVFVGRLTSRGMRSFYFYGPDTATLAKAVVTFGQKVEAYPMTYVIRHDPGWSAFSENLYPSLREQQLVANRDVLAQLVGAGDRIDVTRRIDHFALFSSETARSEFEAWASSKGFSGEGHTETAAEMPFHFDFSRSDTPVDIDPVVLDIWDKVTGLAGLYNGWECQIVR